MKKATLKPITIRPTRTDDPQALHQTLAQLEADLRSNLQIIQATLDAIVEKLNDLEA